jgi:hypothetical protein
VEIFSEHTSYRDMVHFNVLGTHRLELVLFLSFLLEKKICCHVQILSDLAWFDWAYDVIASRVQSMPVNFSDELFLLFNTSKLVLFNKKG